MLHPKISRGRGGSADSIVVQAHRLQGAYDRKVVVLDNDKSTAEMSKARQEAVRKKLNLLNIPLVLKQFSS